MEEVIKGLITVIIKIYTFSQLDIGECILQDGWEILLGETFSSGGGNLMRSDFDHSNLFQN